MNPPADAHRSYVLDHDGHRPVKVQRLSPAQLMAQLGPHDRAAYLLCGDVPQPKQERHDTPLTPEQQHRIDAILKQYILKPEYAESLRQVPERTKIMQSDLGAIHGEYDEDQQVIRVNPKMFDMPETFGDPPVDHLTRTFLHEVCHAWWWQAGFENDPEWLKLSGWQQQDETPPSYARYVETRPGWPQKPSHWCYQENAWFTRPYAAKTPSEDYADSGAWVLIGWDGAFQSGGQAKLEYVRGKLTGQARKEADAPEGDGHWVTIDGRPVFLKDGSSGSSKATMADNTEQLSTALGHGLKASMPALATEDERQAIKAGIATSIAQRLAGKVSQDSLTDVALLLNVEPTADALSSALVSAWAAGTSKSGNAVLIALHAAVLDEFNVKDANIEHLKVKSELLPGISPRSKDRQLFDSLTESGRFAVLKAFVRAQYENTQAWLADHHIGSVTALRGTGIDGIERVVGHSIDKAGRYSLPLQPASSFTVDDNTAIRFAKDPLRYDKPTAVVAMRVPASDVLATARSGWGALPESEIVVIGGKHSVAVVPVRPDQVDAYNVDDHLSTAADEAKRLIK